MSNQLAQINNSLIASGKKRGLEEPIQEGELEIPRAKLLQAMSPEIVAGKEGIRAGMIVNSMTGMELPKEFIPIFKFTNWIRFNPRDNMHPDFNSDFKPGEIIWRSSNPEDERVRTESAFGQNGEKPKAVTFMNFLSYFHGVDMPVIVSFAKTSYKAGRHLLSLVRFSEGDMFSKKYKLGVKLEQNIGSFYVLTVEPAGKVNNDEFALCESVWEEFSSRREKIKMHIEEETEEGVKEEKRPF